MTEAHVPDKANKKQVEKMGGLGLPHEQIGAIIGIDAKTLRKYYREELTRGKAQASERVAQTLFSKATEDRDTTALIWWTKAQMGWRNEATIEHKGEVTQNVTTSVERFANILTEYKNSQKEGALSGVIPRSLTMINE